MTVQYNKITIEIAKRDLSRCSSQYAPAFHFISRPVVVAPWHLRRAEDEAEDEAEEYRQEDAKHQALETDQLQIPVSYDGSEGQRHHGSLRSMR